MKALRILAFVICVLLLSCDSDDYPTADIPSVVLNKFRSSYPEASEVDWKQIRDGYEVDFKLNEKDAEVRIDISGDILKEKQEIKFPELPEGVLAALEEDYGREKLEDPQLIRAGDSIYYQVEIANFLFDKELVIDEKGMEMTSVPYWD